MKKSAIRSICRCIKSTLVPPCALYFSEEGVTD
jgi:hypothetical protein